MLNQRDPFARFAMTDVGLKASEHVGRIYSHSDRTSCCMHYRPMCLPAQERHEYALRRRVPSIFDR